MTGTRLVLVSNNPVLGHSEANQSKSNIDKNKCEFEYSFVFADEASNVVLQSLSQTYCAHLPNMYFVLVMILQTRYVYREKSIP